MAVRCPLKSYRKIRDNRVDAMTGALADGHVLYVSARLHAGWYRLFLRDDDEQPVITILADEEALGGHAFVIVGYSTMYGCLLGTQLVGPGVGRRGDSHCCPMATGRPVVRTPGSSKPNHRCRPRAESV